MTEICSDIMLKSSQSILLNSSKQVQHPYSAIPFKIFSIKSLSIYSEQLRTINSIPNPFAKSFIDSVFPVPAGPEAAAPIFKFKAPDIVSQHFSVKGVIIILCTTPKYSKPYLQ